jgi:hypothetical protein
MGAVWAQCWSGSLRLTPSQADRDRDRPAAGEPASKSDMAFVRRTEEALVFLSAARYLEPQGRSSNLPSKYE